MEADEFIDKFEALIREAEASGIDPDEITADIEGVLMARKGE